MDLLSSFLSIFHPPFRIQSVVCDTAYRTSENMLVCAPTGAGKTNVAMLCITQTIKQGGHPVRINAWPFAG